MNEDCNRKNFVVCTNFMHLVHLKRHYIAKGTMHKISATLYNANSLTCWTVQFCFRRVKSRDNPVETPNSKSAADPCRLSCRRIAACLAAAAVTTCFTLEWVASVVDIFHGKMQGE